MMLFSSVKEMEVQLISSNRESKNISLKIQKGKTKFMTNYDTNESIEIGNEQVEKVEQEIPVWK